MKERAEKKHTLDSFVGIFKNVFCTSRAHQRKGVVSNISRIPKACGRYFVQVPDTIADEESDDDDDDTDSGEEE